MSTEESLKARIHIVGSPNVIEPHESFHEVAARFDAASVHYMGGAGVYAAGSIECHNFRVTTDQGEVVVNARAVSHITTFKELPF